MLRDTLKSVRQFIYLTFMSPDYHELIEYRLKQSMSVKIARRLTSGSFECHRISKQSHPRVCTFHPVFNA